MINVGDALLTFRASTEELDAAFARVNSDARTKLQPAADEVDKLGQRFKVVGTSADQSGNQFTEFGRRGSSASREARNSVDLLAHSLGVSIPRELKSIISTLPGVGDAFRAAFIPVVAVAIISVIAGVIKKLVELREQQDKVAAGWAEHERIVADTSRGIVSQINEQEQKIIELTQGPIAALEFALTHLQTTAFATFQQISAGIASAAKAMKDQAGFTNVFGDAAKDLEKFQVSLEKTMRVAASQHPEDPLAAYKAGITAVQEKERELTELIAKRTAASGKDASAAIDGLHAEREAINELIGPLQQGVTLDEKRIELAKDQTSAEVAKEAAEAARKREVEEAKAFEARKARFQAELAFGKAEEEQFKAAGKAVADAIEIISGKAQLPQFINATAAELGGLTAAATKAGEALKVLGIDSITQLEDNLAKSEQAFEKLRTSGVATYDDLANAELRIIELQIRLAQAEGRSTAALEKQAQSIRTRMIPAISQWAQVQQQVSSLIVDAIKSTVAAYLQGGISIGQALAQAFKTALAIYAADQVASGFMALADAFHALIDPLWAAMRGTSAAQLFVASAKHFATAAVIGSLAAIVPGGGGSSGSSSGGGDQGVDKSLPANQPEQQPVQVVNVQHLATGALIQKRTIAMIGDSIRGGNAREGIIPLDDDRAMDAIGGGIAERVIAHLGDRVGGGDVHNHYNIKGDVIDYNQLMKKQSRMVQRGTGRLSASNSMRVTRRG